MNAYQSTWVDDELSTFPETVARFIFPEDVAYGTLDNETASMAKWWVNDRQQKVIDECAQLHGGYG